MFDSDLSNLETRHLVLKKWCLLIQNLYLQVDDDSEQNLGKNLMWILKVFETVPLRLDLYSRLLINDAIQRIMAVSTCLDEETGIKQILNQVAKQNQLGDFMLLSFIDQNLLSNTVNVQKLLQEPVSLDSYSQSLIIQALYTEEQRVEMILYLVRFGKLFFSLKLDKKLKIILSLLKRAIECQIPRTEAIAIMDLAVLTGCVGLQRELKSRLQKTQIVGYLEGIHVQISCNPERLVVKKEEDVQTSNLGILELTNMELKWYGYDLEFKLGLTIKYSEIQFFHMGKMKSSEFFYLGLNAQSSMVRFYPFLDQKISELLMRFVPQIKEQTLIKYNLAKQIHVTRQRFHVEPIKNNKELQKTIQKLMDKQQMYEMERLFHSCKHRVTATLKILKQYWKKANSETQMLKILWVLDRLLDPIIFETQNLIYVKKWMQRVEQFASYKTYIFSNTDHPF